MMMKTPLEEKEDCKEDSNNGEDDRRSRAGDRPVDVLTSAKDRIINDVFSTRRESDYLIIIMNRVTEAESATDNHLNSRADLEFAGDFTLLNRSYLNLCRLLSNNCLVAESDISGEIISDVVENNVITNLTFSAIEDSNTDKDELKVVLGACILVVVDVENNLKGVGGDRGLSVFEVSRNIRSNDVLSDVCILTLTCGSCEDSDTVKSGIDLSVFGPGTAERESADNSAIRINLNEARHEETDETSSVFHTGIATEG